MLSIDGPDGDGRGQGWWDDDGDYPTKFAILSGLNLSLVVDPKYHVSSLLSILVCIANN